MAAEIRTKMKMPRMVYCLPALCSLTALSSSADAAAPGGQARRPNIVIVLTDDQGYGDLSCHGNPILKTPNLDRLHAEAVRFTDFHVSSICTPTRSQLMTGVDSLRNRACNWGYGQEFIRLDIPTIAEIFGAAGYRTGQFGKWHLGDMFPHRPGDRGFRESVRFGGASIQQSSDHWDSDGFDDFYWHNDVLKQYRGYCTDIFFDEAMRFMGDSRRAGEPFLAYLATGAVHDPCFVEDKYRRPFMGMQFRGEPLAPNVHSFYGMLSNFDGNMGRLDAFLAREGLRENTIVIFMSDNGGVQGVPIFDAGMKGTKGSLTEGGHRQSCFIRWPAGGLRPPGNVGGLTQIQDLLPTLMELSGVARPRPGTFDGISLAPLLRGEPQALDDRMLVVQFGWGGRGNGTVLWRRWRLTGGRGGAWQLHNLDRDPYQNSDVTADHPDVVARMLGHYESWWRDIEPALKLREFPHAGDARANPLHLACFDYFEHRQLSKQRGNVTLQTHVRRGMQVHGKWRIRFVAAGAYAVALRRWPAEADAAITAGLPLLKLTDPYPEGYPDRHLWYNTPEVGVALPIASVRARLGSQEKTAAVGTADRAVRFTFHVASPGEIDLETWFLDAQGKELCSAYYAEITRLDLKGPGGG